MAEEEADQESLKRFEIVTPSLGKKSYEVKAADLKKLPQAMLKKISEDYPIPLLLTCAGMRFVCGGGVGRALDMNNPSPADEKAVDDLYGRLHCIITDPVTLEDIDIVDARKKNAQDDRPLRNSVRGHILAIINPEPQDAKQDAKQAVGAWAAKYDLPFRSYFSTYVVEVAGSERRFTEGDIAKVWVQLSDEDHKKFHESFAANYPGEKTPVAGASPSPSPSAPGSGSGGFLSKVVKKVTGGVGAGSAHGEPSDGSGPPPSGPPAK